MGSNGFGNVSGFGSGVGKTSLLDRLTNNLSDTAHGFFPGLLTIGGAVSHDVAGLATGHTSELSLPGLGMDMAKGFNQSSFLPPLLSGHPIEALHRASQRPFDALMDASLAFPAYDAAGSVALRAGHATGNAGLLDWGAKAQGLVKAPDSLAESIRNVQAARDSESVAGVHFDPELPTTNRGLPATFDGPDGPLLTREYSPFATGGMKNVGNDIFLRRSFRTLPIGKPHGMVDDAGAIQQMDDYKNNSNYSNPQGTLGEDAFSESVSHRANNPLLASMGDSATEFAANNPFLSKLLKPTKRIGRHAAMQEILDTRTDSDRGYLQYQKLTKEYRDHLRATDPETFGQMDDGEINKIIAEDGFLRSTGTQHSELPDVMDRFNPAKVYEGTLPNEWLDGTPAEARGRGLQFERQSDKSLLPDSDYSAHATLRDMLAHHHDDLNRHTEGVFDPELKLRVFSKNHMRARQSRAMALMDAAGTLSRVMRKAEMHGHIPKLVRKDGELNLSGISHEDAINVIKSVVHDPDAKLIFEQNPDLLEQARIFDEEIPPEEGYPSLEELFKGDQLSDRGPINDSINQYKQYEGELKNYDEHSTDYLHYNHLLNGTIASDGTGRAPGIINKLKELHGNTHLAKVDREGEAAKAFYAHMDHLIKQGGEYSKESLAGMMDETRMQENRQRGSEMLHNETRDGANFYPMDTIKGEDKGAINSGRREHDVAPEVRRLDKRPGDPHELMLKGNFKTDHDTITNYFRKKREEVAGERIVQRMRSMAREVDDATLEKLMKSQHVGTSEDFLKGGRPRSFVVVRRDDFINQTAGEMQDKLRSIKAAILAKNEHNSVGAAADVQKAIDALDGVKVGNPHIPVSDQAMDVGVKKQLDPQKNYILPTDLYRGVLDELHGAQASIGSFYHTIQNGWKFMVLHTRFVGWMRNNIIGAHLMAAMSRGPLSYLKHLGGLTDARYREAFNVLEDSRNADVLQTGSASQARINANAVNDPESLSKAGQYRLKVKNVQDKLSDVNAKYADDPMRKFHMMDQILEQVKLMEESLGKKIEVTPELIENFLGDEELRKEMAKRTGVDLVNFGDTSAFERKWMASIFPFYSWMKGSSKAMQRLASDSPGGVLAATSIGEEGNRHRLDQNGKFMPEFTKDMWDPGQPGGMSINTAGFLPYMTPIDLGNMLPGMIPDIIPGDRTTAMHYNQYGGENIISNLNPLLGGVVQAATGKNAYFGTPLPNNSFGTNFMNQTMAGLPLVKLFQQLVQNETGPTATSNTNRPLTIAKYFGAPLTSPRIGQMHARGVDELNQRYKNPAAITELLPMENR